jgi:hypothetical protein
MTAIGVPFDRLDRRLGMVYKPLTATGRRSREGDGCRTPT